MTKTMRVWQQSVRLVLAGAAFAACVGSAATASAQSTIFNIPTTDTVSPKKGYFEFDYLVQLPAPDEGQFQVFTPRFVAGVTPMMEAGVNFGNVHYADGGGTFASIQPNVKYKFFANDDKGLAAAAGIIGYFALNKTDETDNFGQYYVNFSKKIKSGARFHVGGWGSISYGDDNTGGVLLGYEQPLSKTISFVTDWFSGNNFWGYWTPGISVVLPHSGLLNIGYSIGNNSYNDDPGNDTHNKAFFIYYGITFP